MEEVAVAQRRDGKIVHESLFVEHKNPVLKSRILDPS